METAVKTRKARTGTKIAKATSIVKTATKRGTKPESIVANLMKQLGISKNNATIYFNKAQARISQ